MVVKPTESSERTAVGRILNALPAMVGHWDRDMRNVMANDAYVEFFGMSPQEMRGTHIRDVLGPDLYELNRQFIEGALAGETQQFDREIRTPAGEVRYTQASYVPDVIDGVVHGFFALVTDITDRRRAEREVERGRARLAEAEQIARLGSWEWDIAEDSVVWSDGLFAIYGISPADFEGRYQPSSDRVHPDDRKRLDAGVRRALETCEPIDQEYRIVRPDGRVRRLHARAEVVADAEGKPLRLVGTAQDVTEVRATAEFLDETAADLGRRAAELQSLSTRTTQPRDKFDQALTPRQREILALISDGLSNAEIGERLFLAEPTVKWHVRKILRALGVANRAQAVARYLAA